MPSFSHTLMGVISGPATTHALSGAMTWYLPGYALATLAANPLPGSPTTI